MGWEDIGAVFWTRAKDQDKRKREKGEKKKRSERERGERIDRPPDRATDHRTQGRKHTVSSRTLPACSSTNSLTVANISFRLSFSVGQFHTLDNLSRRLLAQPIAVLLSPVRTFPPHQHDRDQARQEGNTAENRHERPGTDALNAGVC